MKKFMYRLKAVGAACALAAGLGAGIAIATTAPAFAAAGNKPVVTNCDGRAEAFTVGPGNHLYHAWQTSPGGSWTGWHSLGGILIYPQIGAIVNSNCRVEAFGIGSDHAMWHIWQTNPGGGPWSSWASLGGSFDAGPSQAYVAVGNVAALIVKKPGIYPWYCDTQTRPASGPWTGWYRCTSPIQV
jgi:hypothetical protein